MLVTCYLSLYENYGLKIASNTGVYYRSRKRSQMHIQYFRWSASAYFQQWEHRDYIERWTAKCGYPTTDSEKTWWVETTFLVLICLLCSLTSQCLTSDDATNQDADDYFADSSDDELGLRTRKRVRKGNGESKRKKGRSRCRNCGQYYSLPEWKRYHENKIPSKEDWGNRRPCARHLPNGKGNKVGENCSVKEAYFAPGFPCPYPKRLPRPKKK